MIKKVFKYLIYLLLSVYFAIGCNEFKPADEDSWEGGDEEGYYTNQKGDTTQPSSDYYIGYLDEYYKITCTISDSIKTLYKKTVSLDSVITIKDSIKVIPGKNYNFKFDCTWEGANPANTLQFNIDKIYYYIKLTNKENGNVNYNDNLIPTNSKLYIRFGVLRSYQDIGN